MNAEEADLGNIYNAQSVNERLVDRMMFSHFSLRLGTPPPTHQSTIHLSAFRLSSRPPLPFPRSAIVLSVSNALTLCTGLLCTKRVNALSLSDKVPLCKIFCRNEKSDVVVVAVDEDCDWYVATVSA